jgi:hypothetical protein
MTSAWSALNRKGGDGLHPSRERTKTQWRPVAGGRNHGEGGIAALERGQVEEGCRRDCGNDQTFLQRRNCRKVRAKRLGTLPVGRWRWNRRGLDRPIRANLCRSGRGSPRVIRRWLAVRGTAETNQRQHPRHEQRKNQSRHDCKLLMPTAELARGGGGLPSLLQPITDRADSN